MPVNGLDSACLAIFQKGEETRWRRLALRAVLRSLRTGAAYPLARSEPARRRIKAVAREQLKRDLRDEGYGFVGITVAFVLLTTAGAALSFVVERLLSKLFPRSMGGYQDRDFRQQLIEWSRTA